MMPHLMAPGDLLEQGRVAAARHAWSEAYEALSSADAAERLGPEDLEQLAKASWWTGRSAGSIEARERAYAAYLERGDVERAAFCALTLRREHATKLEASAAKGWLSRAERLLADRPESSAHGYLAIAHAELAWHTGEFDRALEHVGRAVELGARTGDRDLQAWAVMRRGEILVARGDLEEGWEHLEEVAVAAIGGELGPYTTGAVFCNVISTCRELADYARGKEWSDAATRWCERQSINGFPGVCRVRRAEVMRLLGSWADAEDEARRACEELPTFSPYYAGEAYHELGEVRLRMGDLVAAEEALHRARELGSDPQPGLGLLLLAQGKVDAATASIRRSLEETTWDKLARARLLPAQVEIARATADAPLAREGAAELASIAEEYPTSAIQANAAWASGIANLLEDSPADAVRDLRRAAQTWHRIDAPYEAAGTALALAEAHLAEGDADAAALELRTARSTFERLGATRDAEHADAMLERLGAPAPARTVRTFLFSDVVGSTALLEAIGDEAWDELRRWHDQALRACFELHGGEEIDHAGDGFFVAFPEAGAAIACAIEIQRRLADHRRDHGFAPQVRIGLHAAEALAAGGDYTGKGVHTAARIGALAGGGEIVASAGTVQGTPHAGADPTLAELKGLAEPVEVVRLEWRSQPG